MLPFHVYCQRTLRVSIDIEGVLLFLKCALVCTRMGHLTTEASSRLRA